MSREQRTLVEEELKSGRLPCVVATSSLELGIDMGAVDLVVQVEAPPSVASGLQRVGRAGHQVGAVSRGVVFPKYRGDLVSCAVVAERMTAGAIESMRYPRNPLDVLAQQIVAMVALEPWQLDDLARVVRRAAPFAALPESALHSVLDMLAGRYPSEEFGELRARITWDRVTDTAAGPARRAAARGHLRRHHPRPRPVHRHDARAGPTGAGSRVGELDEEMVYESRVGDTFLLGTSSWTRRGHHPRPRDRHPGAGGARADAVLEGRVGRQAAGAGARGRGVRAGDVRACPTRPRASGPRPPGSTQWAVDNLLAYLREQREATRHVPSDRTILVERFRDELGDWRLVVHSPFGSQVNGPWGLAIAARMRERRGVEVHAVGRRRRHRAAAARRGRRLRRRGRAHRGGRAARPGRGGADRRRRAGRLVAVRVAVPGVRGPRAAAPPPRPASAAARCGSSGSAPSQLLAVAGRYEQFPVTLEAMRECVQDVYDLPGLRELMADVQSRTVQVVEMATPAPSPFARSLLFGYVGMFLYESDAPLAERRAAALSLDSTLLAELLGSEAIRELLDPEVLAEVEARCSGSRRTGTPATPRAPPTCCASSATSPPRRPRPAGCREEWLVELESARRAIRVRIAGEERWLSIEDAGRVRDALGAALPGRGAGDVHRAGGRPARRPRAALRPHPRAVPAGRVRGPVRARRRGGGRRARPAGRRGPAGARRAAPAGRPAARRRPAQQPTRIEYCDAEVLRRLRRASLARLRAEVEPVEQRALGRFLPAWQGVQYRRPEASGAAGCAARPARRTCSAWSSSSPGRRCRRARWSR